VKKPTEDSAAAPAAGAAAPSKEETAPATGEQSAPADKKVVSDPNSIYVSNLPFAAKQNQVTDAFKGFGKIVSVSMQSDKGYAFIEYDTIEAAHSAIKLATENPVRLPLPRTD
jgi:RNA recognition motif-containing protein